MAEFYFGPQSGEENKRHTTPKKERGPCPRGCGSPIWHVDVACPFIDPKQPETLSSKQHMDWEEDLVEDMVKHGWNVQSAEEALMFFRPILTKQHSEMIEKFDEYRRKSDPTIGISDEQAEWIKSFLQSI